MPVLMLVIYGCDKPAAEMLQVSVGFIIAYVKKMVLLLDPDIVNGLIKTVRDMVVVKADRGVWEALLSQVQVLGTHVTAEELYLLPLRKREVRVEVSGKSLLCPEREYVEQPAVSAVREVGGKPHPGGILPVRSVFLDLRMSLIQTNDLWQRGGDRHAEAFNDKAYEIDGYAVHACDLFESRVAVQILFDAVI